MAGRLVVVGLLAALWCSARAQASTDKIYWTEYGNAGTPGLIKRANAADLSQPESVWTGTGTEKMTGLALDVEFCTMYYGIDKDPGGKVPGQIMKANLDGSGAAVFYTSPSASAPFNIWIDLVNKRLWWSESRSKIKWASIDTTSGQYGVAIYVPTNNGNSDVLQETYLAVDVAASKVYVTDVGYGTIIRQSTTATSTDTQEIFIDSFDLAWSDYLWSPTGLLIDTANRKLLYADSGYRSVSMVSLTAASGAAEQVLISTVTSPAGMVLVGSTLYVADEPSPGSLLMGTISGGTLTSTRKLILGTNALPARPKAVAFMNGTLTTRSMCFSTTTTTTTITSTKTSTRTTTSTTRTTTSTTATSSTSTSLTTTKTTSTSTTSTSTVTKTTSSTTTTLTTTSSTETSTTSRTSTSTTTTASSTTSSSTSSSQTSTTLSSTTTTTSLTSTTTATLTETSTSTTSTLTTTSTTTTRTTTTTTSTTHTSTTSSTATVTTTTITSTITVTVTSTTTTTTRLTGLSIQGSLVFTADTVSPAVAKEAVRSTLAQQLGVMERQIEVTLTVTRRRLGGLEEEPRPRRLAPSTFLANYKVNNVDALTSLAMMSTITAMNSDSTSIAKKLTSVLVSLGASASSVVLAVVSAPFVSIPPNVTEDTPCGLNYCPAKSLPKLSADAKICTQVLTCAAAAVSCCMSSRDEGSTTGASGGILAVVLASLGGLILCCAAGSAVMVRRRRRGNVRPRVDSEVRQKLGLEEIVSESKPEQLFSVPVTSPAAASLEKRKPLSPSRAQVAPRDIDSLGSYTALAGLKVRKYPGPESEVMTEVPVGADVEVLQVQDHLATHGVVMARIAQPAGWVTLRDAQGERFMQRRGGTPSSARSKGMDLEFVHTDIRKLEGEWRPYNRQGCRTKALVKVDERGRLWTNNLRSGHEDLVHEPGAAAVVRRDGWLLLAGVSTDDELLWSKAGEYSALWKRLKPCSEFSIGEAVLWTKDNSKEVPVGTLGEVVGFGDNSLRVKFPKLTLDAPSSDLLPAELAERDEQAKAMLEILQGEWRLCAGDVVFPGLVTISADGHTLYNGMHWPEQDLLILAGGVLRGDGWSVKMDSSSSHDLLWCNEGEPSITWRRVKPSTDYVAGEKVLWTEESIDVPAGTVGVVAGVTASSVRVAFKAVRLDIPAAQLLPAPADAASPTTPQRQIQDVVVAAASGAVIPADASAGASARDILLSIPMENDEFVARGGSDSLDKVRPPPLLLDRDPSMDQVKSPGQTPSQLVKSPGQTPSQQVKSPGHTPSTGITLPVSPGLVPSKVSQPSSLELGDRLNLILPEVEQEAVRGLGMPSVPESPAPSLLGPAGTAPLFAAPPGAKAVGATPSGSNKGSGRWGAGWMQALTGPVGSSMSGIFRSGQAGGLAPLGEERLGSEGGGQHGPQSHMSSPSSAAGSPSTGQSGSPGTVVQAPEASAPVPPVMLVPVVTKAPRAPEDKRRQILV